MKTNKPTFALRKYLLQMILTPGIILTATLVITIVFSILYVTLDLPVFYILFYISVFVMIVSYVIASFLTYKSLYKSQYESLYETTRYNYQKIRDGETDLRSYTNTDIDEINELNNDITLIESKFKCSYVVTYVPNYANVDLEYIDKDLDLVTYESFERELSNIIMLSQSYRNVLIDISFSLNIFELSAENQKYIIHIFKELFKDYKGALFMPRRQLNSLLVYLPVIDSMSRIEEQIISVIRDSSLTIRDFEGLRYVSARFAIVAYPYSGIDELISDLRYAKRQGKVINFYLPKRILNNVGKSLMLSDAMNINYIASLLDNLSGLNYNHLEQNADYNLLSNLFTDLCKYLDIHDSGIFKYDKALAIYEKVVSNSYENAIFKNGKVESSFVDCLCQSCDDDNSYFFSKRSHASQYIGRELDLYHLCSGYYYVIRDEDNKVEALIYFFNHDGKELIIDSYLREALFLISGHIKHYFEVIRKKKEIDIYRNESEYLMSLTKYSLYKVDRKSYNLEYFSKDLTTRFPYIKLGEPCYKVLYGLEKPCHDCPLKTFKKQYMKQKGEEYETSLILNDERSTSRSLLIENLSEGDSNGDLYNKDLLINSYLALYKNIRNSYYINGRGYVVLLAFDNIDSILEKQGSEGVNFVIRSFLKRLKVILNTDEFYSFNNDAVALLLHNVGHVDVINACEKIYEESKKHLLGEGYDDALNITYMPLRWPSGFASAEDFMRHIYDFYYSGNHPRNKDFIYFFDHNISRSASKRAFIVSVIEQEFSGAFSSVNLQPIIKAKDKRIIGAEILLRINNVYSNAIFNAEEISQIAEQEGKTGLITESLINFIGNMYKEYGNSVFKINRFERIAINVDSTYLNDLSLLQGIIKLNDMYKFPNNFLSFEIPEEIIPSHTAEIQRMARELSSAHILFSVDRYTGRHIRVESLKELGFKEIKIARNLVYKVDTDSARYNEVKDIVNTAKNAGIGVSVVGVENSAQFTILKEFDEEMNMQGFHFYKPLSRSDFISALISHNREY